MDGAGEMEERAVRRPHRGSPLNSISRQSPAGKGFWSAVFATEIRKAAVDFSKHYTYKLYGVGSQDSTGSEYRALF